MTSKDQHVLDGRVAGFVTRLLAYTIDLVVVAGIVALGGWIAVLVDNTLTTLGVNAPVDLAAIYLILVPFIIGLYFVMFWSLTGRTIGKWVLGLRIVNPEGRPPTIGRSIVRALGYLVSAIALWMGYLWVLVDNERQAWHDHMADTYVIYDYSRDTGDTYQSIADRSDAV